MSNTRERKGVTRGSDDLTLSAGRAFISPGVMQKVRPEFAIECLVRHICGDWGDVSALEMRRNNLAWQSGECVRSVYRDEAGTEFWILTDLDRTLSRILLPSEFVVLQ